MSAPSDFGLPASFAVSEVDVDDGTHVIAVRGELDLETAQRFERPLEAAIERGSRRIVVDLSETVFVGSNGLATLLAGLRRLSREGGRMAIVCANPTVLRMFEITRTDATFAIHPTRQAALDALAPG